MHLNDFCDDYIDRNPSITADGTARLCRLSVRHFERYLQRDGEAADLTDDNIAGYMRHRLRLGRASATVTYEAKKLLALARNASQKGLVATPTIRLGKPTQPPPAGFTRSELRRLFRAAKHSRRTIGGVPDSVYFVALLSLAWECAERSGALMKVSRQDISGRWITLRHRKQNGRALVRKVRRRTAWAIAKLLAAHDGELLFGFVHVATMYNHLQRIVQDAGLPADRWHKLHCIRKSHASYLHVAGGDATASLGHSSDSVTRAHYFVEKITQRRAAIDYLFSPLSWWDRFLAALGL